MATPTSDASVINPPPPPGNQLVFLNVGFEIYIKLDGENYLAWLIQFRALLTGYDLFGYVEDTKPCPSKTLQNATTINPDYTKARSTYSSCHHLIYCCNSCYPPRHCHQCQTGLGHSQNHVCWKIKDPHHGFKATCLHFWEMNSIND